MDKLFNIENQYLMYLKRVDIKEEDMVENQRTEMKRTFYGACGQLLILLRDEVSRGTEEEGVIIMQDMLNQVSNFFKKECSD
jgi:hypothetical protein